jgi:hypothetical protein
MIWHIGGRPFLGIPRRSEPLLASGDPDLTLMAGSLRLGTKINSSNKKTLDRKSGRAYCSFLEQYIV